MRHDYPATPHHRRTHDTATHHVAAHDDRAFNTRAHDAGSHGSTDGIVCTDHPDDDDDHDDYNNDDDDHHLCCDGNDRCTVPVGFVLRPRRRTRRRSPPTWVPLHQLPAGSSLPGLQLCGDLPWSVSVCLGTVSVYMRPLWADENTHCRSDDNAADTRPYHGPANASAHKRPYHTTTDTRADGRPHHPCADGPAHDGSAHNRGPNYGSPDDRSTNNHCTNHGIPHFCRTHHQRSNNRSPHNTHTHNCVTHASAHQRTNDNCVTHASAHQRTQLGHTHGACAHVDKRTIDSLSAHHVVVLDSVLHTYHRSPDPRVDATHVDPGHDDDSRTSHTDADDAANSHHQQCSCGVLFCAHDQRALDSFSNNHGTDVKSANDSCAHNACSDHRAADNRGPDYQGPHDDGTHSCPFDSDAHDGCTDIRSDDRIADVFANVVVANGTTRVCSKGTTVPRVHQQHPLRLLPRRGLSSRSLVCRSLSFYRVSMTAFIFFLFQFF